MVRQIARYCGPNRKLDLVLCFHANSFVAHDWEQAIVQLFDTYGPLLYSLQVTEEPNLYHLPGDGRFAHIAQVVVHGVKFAKQEARRRGLDVRIGFNAVPCFNPDDRFWTSLRSLVDGAFLDVLDYVGFDFFPDVFRHIEQLNELSADIQALLTYFRQINLPGAGIGTTVPIAITENGWPTSSIRPDDQQAVVLETVIRMVVSLRHTLQITQYTLFSLCDADSKQDDMMYQFGILRDDYSLKPAFDLYRKLIAELSA